MKYICIRCRTAQHGQHRTEISAHAPWYTPILLFSLLLILTLLSLFLSGCSFEATPQMETDCFFAMDTEIELQLPADEANEEIFAATEQLIRQREAALSKTKENSEISRWNLQGDTCVFSDETAELLQTALTISNQTDGAFSLSIAPLSYLWKDIFTSKVPELPAKNKIEAAKALVNDKALSMGADHRLTHTLDGIQIELGAIAKGDTCQKAVTYLSEKTAYGLISFGGNIGVFGKKPDGSDWKIGIKDPKNPKSLCGWVLIKSGFVSVSGNYERYATIDKKRYHHIIDPATGYPAEAGLCGVAVISADGAIADALSTALFVMGYDRAMALYEANIFSFEAVFNKTDGTLCVTPGLVDSFTAAE